MSQCFGDLMTLLSRNELMRESSKEARFTYILHVFVLMKIRDRFPSVSIDLWSLGEKTMLPKHMPCT